MNFHLRSNLLKWSSKPTLWLPRWCIQTQTVIDNVKMLIQSCPVRLIYPVLMGCVNIIFTPRICVCCLFPCCQGLYIGVGVHGAQVESGTSVVWALGRALLSVQSQLSCSQSLGAYAAWAHTNRLCAVQAGLGRLKLVHTGFTPVGDVTYYRADWMIYVLFCTALDFFFCFFIFRKMSK